MQINRSIMNDTRQTIKKEIADLFKDVLEYRDSEKFKELLQFCVRLNTLGSYNAMLVKMQCPGAKYVLSRQGWAEYNRRLVPNARPLMILAPFGPVSFVFDISMTEPMPDKPEFNDDYFEYLSNPYEANGELDSKEYETFLSNLKFFGIKKELVYHFSNERVAQIQRYDSEPLLNVVKWKQEIPLRFYLKYLLSINGQSSMETTFVSICHELAHMFCEHIEAPIEKGEPLWEKRELDKDQYEFEAETVAWLITRRHGIKDSKSVEYLADYVDRDGKIPIVDVDKIMSAVDKIEQLFQTIDVKRCWLYKNCEDFQRSVDDKLGKKESRGKSLRPKY